jgi:hypothetical protein
LLLLADLGELNGTGAAVQASLTALSLRASHTKSRRGKGCAQRRGTRADSRHAVVVVDARLTNTQRSLIADVVLAVVQALVVGGAGTTNRGIARADTVQTRQTKLTRCATATGLQVAVLTQLESRQRRVHRSGHGTEAIATQMVFVLAILIDQTRAVVAVVRESHHADDVETKENGHYE